MMRVRSLECTISGPEERIRAGPHSARFHQATSTNGRASLYLPAPRLRTCTTAVPHEDSLFSERAWSPMPLRTAARSRTHARRWLTVRGDSSLPRRWPHPNPASVSLHLGGRQNRAWGLTVISGRRGRDRAKIPGQVADSAVAGQVCQLCASPPGASARRFSRAYRHGWLPGVEEGDDGEDALVGVQGGGDPELAEDAVDVLFYRTLRYPEGLGDPGVGLTRGHQRQHLSFS